MEYVKIAEDRIGSVIGKDGEVKSKIEKILEVKLTVNSKEGFVQIENAGSDPLGEWKARDIVKAISYGISPDTAMSLKDDVKAEGQDNRQAGKDQGTYFGADWGCGFP
jgi:ribosomal RNA assembly protein